MELILRYDFFLFEDQQAKLNMGLHVIITWLGCSLNDLGNAGGRYKGMVLTWFSAALQIYTSGNENEAFQRWEKGDV